MKPLVTDALWERLAPLLPPPPKRRFRFPGRKPIDPRQVLTGILFVLKTGIAWDDLPAELGCGCGKTCRHYLRQWHDAGVWLKLHALLLAELNGADQIDWDRALIDASFAKAPEGGEGTGPNPTDRGKSGSKHHVLTDARGIPLNATTTAANVNEVTQLLNVLVTMPPVGGKPGPDRRLPERIQGDRGTTPGRSGCSSGGWASPRSWPHAGRSTGAAWACTGGSSSGRSPGYTRSAASVAGWTADLTSKRRSSGSGVPSSASGSSQAKVIVSGRS
jgi:transposase